MCPIIPFRVHGKRISSDIPTYRYRYVRKRPSNYEKDLADNGIGKDDADRKQIARRYFSSERDALYAAIQGAPDILFVTIAGNNDANNAFEECIRPRSCCLISS